MRYHWESVPTLGQFRLWNADYRHMATVYLNGDWMVFGHGEYRGILHSGTSPTPDEAKRAVARVLHIHMEGAMIMEKDMLVPVSTWNRVTTENQELRKGIETLTVLNARLEYRVLTENQELRKALAFLIGDWERVHGPLSEEHEAKAALRKV